MTFYIKDRDTTRNVQTVDRKKAVEFFDYADALEYKSNLEKLEPETRFVIVAR